MLKKTVLRGHDSAGPLTEATRLYLSNAQPGVPFFIAGRAPRFNLYPADSGGSPSHGGPVRLWVSRRAARVRVSGDQAASLSVLRVGEDEVVVRRVTPVITPDPMFYSAVVNI